MNKIISKIQFIIYSFFAFVFSLTIISVASLSYGISIPLIVLPNFKAEQLYIKLDKKLILRAKTITVTLSDNKVQEAPILEIPRIAPILDFIRTNFSMIRIETLSLNNDIVTFSYNDHPKQTLDNSISFKGNGIDTLISYNIYEDYAAFVIEDFTHLPTDIKISGKSIYNFKTELSSTQLQLKLSDCAQLDIYLKDDSKHIAFTASSNTFVDLGPIVELFELPEGISQWIVDYNKASSYKLILAKGIHNYSNTDLILDTLFISAKEKDVEYTFNEDLSPVVGSEVDIYFTKGILDVKPKHAFFNDHPIDGGGVKIDFNGEHPLLDLDLMVNTRASQDVIDIIKAYDIALPVVQKTGETKGHIGLHIDLWTLDAYAKAELFIKNSEISLDGTDYQVKNASVRLNKSFLSIDSGELIYQDIFKAHVNGGIELNELIGEFFYNTDYIKLNISDDYKIALAQKTQIHYKFTKDDEIILFNESQWNLNGVKTTLHKGQISARSKLSSVFRFQNIYLSLENMFEAKVQGEFDLAKDYTNLEVDFFNLDYKDLNISSTDTLKTSIILDEEIAHVRLLNKSTVQIKEHNLSIEPTRFRFKEGCIDVYGAKISLENNISTKLSVHHKLGTKKAQLKLENTQLFSEELAFIGPKIKLNYEQRDAKHYFSAPALDLHIQIDNKGVSTTRLNDLSKLLPYSPLLKTYLIKEGHVKIDYHDDVYEMEGMLKNFLPLLSKNGKSITNYPLKGSFRQGRLRLLVSDSVDLRYKTKVNVKMHNIDFNLYPILNYIEKISIKGKKRDLDLSIKTEACNVTLSDLKRTLLADEINIDIKQDHIDAKLTYKEGGILFQSMGNEFTVFGKGLNDTFMNDLFRFSTFEGGSLSFSAYGNFDNYTTLMNIDETVIKDYTVLNNTLAFFNTIPALVTFSVPGYSKEGLKVSNGYISFDINNSIATVKDSKLTSKEIIITSEGTLNLEEDTIDMLMQVKTDIGSSAKNIPLVGYIIFGDETISTTVHVYGNLKDPEIDNAAATSVIVAPYNILKRTITLPLKWFDDIFAEEKEEKKKN